jgi:hypothetical protein
MDIKINEFKLKFFGELDKELLPLGFKYVKSKHGYILKKQKWYFRFLIDCVKWSTSIGITTKIRARNLSLDDTVNKICGTKNKEFNIWGEYPLISKLLEQQLSEKPLSTFYVRSEEDILKTTRLWIEYFQSIGMPFAERVMTDRNFILDIVLKYNKLFFFPNRCHYLPVMCKQLEMSANDIEVICNDLETRFSDFTKLDHFQSPEEYHKRWLGEYYKVKDAVINDKMPSL